MAAGRAKEVHVRKARHSGTCVLCHGPILVGQQISDGSGGGWSHTRCLIAERRSQVIEEKLAYSFGEVGHDPPVHAVAGPWQGPAHTTRAEARNTSLCGKKLSRVKRRHPKTHELCRMCEDLMAKTPKPQPAQPEVKPVLAQLDEQMQELNAVSDQDYTVEFLELGSLSVDMSDAGDGGRLQRPQQRSWVKRIAADFSWARFNRRPPIVSVDDDGTTHIIDGQHQVAAALAAGYPAETRVRCHVYRNLTREQKAKMFREENRDRKSVKPIDLFRGRIAEHEPAAVAINALLTSHGWEIGSHGKVGSFAAVITLDDIYKQKNGPEICRKTLSVITDAWDRSPDSSHSTIAKVVSLFIRQYPDADLGRLASLLRREVSLQPHRIQMWRKEDGAAWKETCVMKLRERYNNRLSANRRLA
jgi:hypothetical protein